MDFSLTAIGLGILEWLGVILGLALIGVLVHWAASKIYHG